jgi:hypothetical protein
MSME